MRSVIADSIWSRPCDYQDSAERRAAFIYGKASNAAVTFRYTDVNKGALQNGSDIVTVLLFSEKAS
jgi:hypothetical protein